MKIDFSFLKGGKNAGAKGKLLKKNPEFLKKVVFIYHWISCMGWDSSWFTSFKKDV